MSTAHPKGAENLHTKELRFVVEGRQGAPLGTLKDVIAVLEQHFDEVRYDIQH